jgi:hypothetical protein
MEIEEKILEILKQNPEEYKHAQDTLKWLLVIKPNANKVLRISALGHDIERAINPWKNITENIHSDEFRKKHANRSANILKDLLEKTDFNKEYIKRIQEIVLKHEWGGDNEQNLLRDADSLSNLEWCDDFFGIKDSEELKQVAKRMSNRISKENKKLIGSIQFKNIEINNSIS